MKSARLVLLASVVGGTAVACQPAPKSAQEILENVDKHIGKRITITAKLRAGVRCKLDTEDGEWKTYCRDCQTCKGPFVVDLGQKSNEFEDWPMILGGTWKRKPIRCEGPLNDVECYPFEPGQKYVLEGVLENSNPPKLFVDGFRKI